MGKSVVLILGAGASVADVASRSKATRPPLDKGFFRDSRGQYERLVESVATYMTEMYDIDVFAPSSDSLEGIMGTIYADLFNRSFGDKPMRSFRTLLQLFSKRLANTTNELDATSKRYLYRILVRYLSKGVKPSDITIITFNQDIQVEKTLELLSQQSRWSRWSHSLFCFPNLYSPVTPWTVTAPPSATARTCFASTPGCSEPHLNLLKLHGSLNWYSRHNSSKPSATAMFNQSRKLYITRRRTISLDMTTGKSRSQYTLPVVVPPVTHKAAVLHHDLQQIWDLAEERLEHADELVVLGYSCPQVDFESSNMLRRANRKRAPGSHTSLIDPNPEVATRYISLLQPKRLDYYDSAAAFMSESG